MAKDDFGDDITMQPKATDVARGRTPASRGRGAESPPNDGGVGGSWGSSPSADPPPARGDFSAEGAEASVGPPIGLLGVAGVLVATSLVLGVRPGSGFVTPLTGWIVGGVLATICVALYFPADVARRTRSWYVGKNWAGYALKALLALVLLAVLLNAWHLADWVARR